MGYDELDRIEISTGDIADFRVSMIQYLREHHAEVLGEDLKLLLLPMGLEMVMAKRFDPERRSAKLKARARERAPLRRAA
jgi:hypothetical protein